MEVDSGGPLPNNDVSAIIVGTDLRAAGSARLHRSVGPQKLVQIESQYAFLVSSLNTDGSRSFDCLLQFAPTRVFSVDRTTGETLRDILRRSSTVNRSGLAFESTVRLVCVDKVGCNSRAELAFAGSRRNVGFRYRCIMHCEAHIVATMGRHLFSDVQNDITCIVCLAMSLRLGTYMHKFRQILRSILMSEDTVIRVG